MACWRVARLASTRTRAHRHNKTMTTAAQSSSRRRQRPWLLLLALAAASATGAVAFVQPAIPAQRQRDAGSCSLAAQQEQHSGNAEGGEGSRPPAASAASESPRPRSRAASAWDALSRRGAVGLGGALLPAAVMGVLGSSAPSGLGGGGGAAWAAAEEFPWVTKGGLLDGVLPESVLIDALPLNNQGIKGMGAALSRINELRGSPGYQVCTDGRVKADLSYVGMEGNSTEEMAEAELSAFRWAKIKGLAENVRAIFNREKDALPYALTIRPNTTAESQQRRRERFASELRLLDDAIASLQNATAREDVPDTLRYQEESLIHLGHLGELMVAKFPFAPPNNDDRKEDDYFNLPRLFGRAEVIVNFKDTTGGGNGGDDGGNGANGNGGNGKGGRPATGSITIIVDGFNAPISAGNFIDLCQRGFYNKLPLKFDKVRSGGRRGEGSAGGKNKEIDLVVAGRYKTGFVDPITGKQRRVPLEVVRAEADGNRPFYGQARNTGIFTRAPPLLSYRTPRAVGLFHPEQDGNGANSEFFWLQQDARCVEQAKALDGKYTLIGYVVGGGRADDLLPHLDEGYMIDTVQVVWGYDHLVRSRVGFIDILLQGDD